MTPVSNSTILQHINQLNILCTQQFEIINNRLSLLENKTNSLQSISSLSLNSNNNNNNSINFNQIEDKITYLNNNIKNVINQSITQFILDNNIFQFISESTIYDILNKNNTIYSASTNILIQFIQQHDTKFLFCFPFQKYIIYFWNFNDNTWEKSNLKVLKNIYNIIQKFIIQKYNSIISELKQHSGFEIKQMQFIENGDLFFVDDFEKKYNDIKKQLFLQLQQI